MVNEELAERKPGRFVLPGNRIRFISPFLFSVIIGMIYTWLIVNETTNRYLGTILPSTNGADLHQYLPVIFPAFVFSVIVQRKYMIVIENISFSCIQAIVAILSLFISLLVVMVFM